MPPTFFLRLLVGWCAWSGYGIYSCELPEAKRIREASGLQQGGKIQDAERVLLAVVDTLTAAGPVGSVCLAVALNNLGSLHQDAGRYPMAERFYTRALRIDEQHGKAGPDTSATLNNLGSLYFETGQYRKAETVRRRVIEMRTAMFGPEHPSVARAIQNLAAQMYVQRRIDRSAELYDRAIGIWIASGSTQTADYATAIHGRGLIAALQGDVASGVKQIEMALEIWARLSLLNPSVAIAEGNAAYLKQKQGAVDEADRHWRAAVGKAELITGPESGLTRKILQGFLAFLRQTRRTSEAKAVKVRLDSLDALLGKEDSPWSALVDITELEKERR